MKNYPKGDPRHLRSLQNVLESFIKSYNNNEKPNYVDLRDLELNIKRLK